MEIVIVLIVVMIAVVFIWLCLQGKKELRQKQKEHDEKFSQAMEERTRQYERFYPIVDRKYKELCKLFEKPNQTTMINVSKFTSFSEIESAQQECGSSWVGISRTCDMWRTKVMDIVDVLYILETYDAVDKNLKQFIHVYAANGLNEENADSIIYRKIVPVNDILFFEAIGDIEYRNIVSGGGNATYFGMSVNGIGFGEIKHDPIDIKTISEDKRAVVLYYKNEDGEGNMLFFPLSELSKLIQLLPEYIR